MTMFHGQTHDELATMETLLLHMNMELHRAAPFLPVTQAIVDNIQASHNELETPVTAGKRISLKRK